MIDFLIDSIENYANTKYNKCIAIPEFAIAYYDLTFVLEGVMVYYINGKKTVLKKNDAIFLPPGTLRKRDFAVVNVKYVSYNFYFSEGKEVTLPEYMPSIITEELKNLLSVFPFPNIHNQNYDHEKCACILNAVLYELINLNENISMNKYIRTMLNYAAVHITEPISLKNMCREVSLSEEYCAYLFKKETGKTVVSYINEKKMQFAEELILKGEMSLESISEYLGYSNYNYFSRLYKKYFGYSPKMTVEYRNALP